MHIVPDERIVAITTKPGIAAESHSIGGCPEKAAACRPRAGLGTINGLGSGKHREVLSMSRRHVVRQRMRRPRKKMSLIAALGHACGISYKSGEHLAKHPEFAWMKDMPARGWTRFTAK